MPKSGLTGNVPLDEMNWMLADTYCSISFLLERLQMVTILLKFDKDFLEDGERELLDLKAAVEVLRTSGCKLRKEVVELRYAPYRTYRNLEAEVLRSEVLINRL